MVVGNRVVMVGSGCDRWVLKVQKGLQPPSSDTLHSPGKPDDHSINIHTTKNLVCHTNELKNQNAQILQRP